MGGAGLRSGPGRLGREAFLDIGLFRRILIQNYQSICLGCRHADPCALLGQPATNPVKDRLRVVELA